MSKDDRDILAVLQFELDFVNSGGYGRSVRTPQKPTAVFRESPSCLNFGDPNNTHPCRDCLLMEFVPPSARAKVCRATRYRWAREERQSTSCWTGTIRRPSKGP